jgi:hypothetical protein
MKNVTTEILKCCIVAHKPMLSQTHLHPGCKLNIAYCLLLLASWFFDPEDGGSMFLETPQHFNPEEHSSQELF